MKTTPEHDERIAKLTFGGVYPHYITKVEKKGRTKEELDQVIEWLTGFDTNKLQELIDSKVTFETFFEKAKVNAKAELITGVICGYRIEEIKTPPTNPAAIARNIKINKISLFFIFNHFLLPNRLSLHTPLKLQLQKLYQSFYFF